MTRTQRYYQQPTSQRPDIQTEKRERIAHTRRDLFTAKKAASAQNAAKAPNLKAEKLFSSVYVQTFQATKNTQLSWQAALIMAAVYFSSGNRTSAPATQAVQYGTDLALCLAGTAVGLPVACLPALADMVVVPVVAGTEKQQKYPLCKFDTAAKTEEIRSPFQAEDTLAPYVRSSEIEASMQKQELVSLLGILNRCVDTDATCITAAQNMLLQLKNQASVRLERLKSSTLTSLPGDATNSVCLYYYNKAIKVIDAATLAVNSLADKTEVSLTTFPVARDYAVACQSMLSVFPDKVTDDIRDILNRYNGALIALSSATQKTEAQTILDSMMTDINDRISSLVETNAPLPDQATKMGQDIKTILDRFKEKFCDYDPLESVLIILAISIAIALLGFLIYKLCCRANRE